MGAIMRIHCFLIRACSATIGVACWASIAIATDSTAQIVAEVSSASYANTLNNQLHTHTGDTRMIGQPGHDAARDNIKSIFEGLGLTTGLDPVAYNSSTYFNVVAEQRGAVHPDQVYIVGAHYDSAGATVPGADDNASGVAAVLEMARALAHHPFDATVRFIAFDCEEAGLIGSTSYANAHASDDIRGMVSMDMVAYNPSSNPNSAYLYYDHSLSSAPAITQDLAAAFASYGNGITTTIERLSSDSSDYAPFAHKGFQAALVIEHEVWHNPNYHTSADSVDTANYIDYAYATNLTRAVTGYLSDAAVPVPEPTSLLALVVGGLVLLSRRR
jgi:hypothetical protein